MIHNFSVYDCGTGQLRYYVEWDSGVREGTTVKLNKKRRNLSTFIQRSSIGEASPIGGTMSPGSYTKKPSLTVSIDAQITKPMNDLSVESPSVQSSNSNGGKNSFPSHLTFLQDHAIQEKAALVYGMWQSLQSITQKLTRAEHDKFSSFTTNQYRVHSWETPTRWLFVLLTDPILPYSESLLKSIYSDYFVPFVIHHPLYRPLREGFRSTVPFNETDAGTMAYTHPDTLKHNVDAFALFHRQVCSFLMSHPYFKK